MTGDVADQLLNPQHAQCQGITVREYTKHRDQLIRNTAP
jgi:hypothetical protein